MTDDTGGEAMDLLPRVGGVDPQASERRPGTGTFARKRRDGREGRQEQPRDDEPDPAPQAPLDPLLEELDRLRAIDPALTDSGAHRALLALRAYQPRPEDVPAPVPAALAPPLTDAAALPEPGP